MHLLSEKQHPIHIFFGQHVNTLTIWKQLWLIKKKKCKGPSAVCPMRPLEGEYLFSCVSLQLNPCSFFLVNLILSFILLFIIVLSSELFLLLSLASWNSLLIFSFFPLSVAKNPTELCLNPAFSGHVIVLSDNMTDLHFPNIDTL